MFRGTPILFDRKLFAFWLIFLSDLFIREGFQFDCVYDWCMVNEEKKETEAEKPKGTGEKVKSSKKDKEKSKGKKLMK